MNKKSLVSEVSISQSKVNVDSMGDDQTQTIPIRKACHICHGNSYVWRGEDCVDCPNGNCDYGFVVVKAPKPKQG